MLQVFLLDATTTFFGLIVFCQLFQLLSYLSLENFRREYLILCHLVRCDVAVTLYIGGGEGTLFMSCNVSCFSQFPKEGRLSNFFFKKAPNVDHSHRLVSEGHLFKVKWKLFQYALGLVIFFTSRYPYTQLYPLVSYRRVYIFSTKKQMMQQNWIVRTVWLTICYPMLIFISLKVISCTQKHPVHENEKIMQNCTVLGLHLHSQGTCVLNSITICLVQLLEA